MVFVIDRRPSQKAETPVPTPHFAPFTHHREYLVLLLLRIPTVVSV